MVDPALVQTGMTTMKRDAIHDALSLEPRRAGDAGRAALPHPRLRLDEAAAAAVAWLGAVFWASLAADWFFEPPASVPRGDAGGGGHRHRRGPRPPHRPLRLLPLGDRNVAAVLERRFPLLNDGLLTAVVLAERRPEEAGFSPEMLAHTCAGDGPRVEGLKLSAVFNPAATAADARRGLAAGSAAIAGLRGIQSTGSMGHSARRTFAMSDELWRAEAH